jgi:hypothetical protein
MVANTTMCIDNLAYQSLTAFLKAKTFHHFILTQVREKSHLVILSNFPSKCDAYYFESKIKPLERRRRKRQKSFFFLHKLGYLSELVLWIGSTRRKERVNMTSALPLDIGRSTISSTITSLKHNAITTKCCYRKI